MSSRSIALLLVIGAFTVVTTIALMDVGYVGVLDPFFRSWGGAQVLVDFVILAVLACLWMTNDARDRGMPAWPFILITVAAGSFGPLLYLLVREFRSPAPQSAGAGIPTRATS